MENVLLLDTSVGSLNKGDDIIMKCIKNHLKEITINDYLLTLPTHVTPFQWYQVLRNSNRVKIYKEAKYKFVGGTNLLTMNMLTHFPQWNINLLNYQPLKGSVLLGVGAGKGETMNRYTKILYKRVLSHEYIHSVRDERTKRFVEEIGLRAINTGCPTLWALDKEFCKTIPTGKSRSVIFTLTHHSKDYVKDQLLIDTLLTNYSKVHFWIQDKKDLGYLQLFKGIEHIHIVSPTLEAFEETLKEDVDYIGTRLHGGIFAMRHGKRSIIIGIDERARGMSETYNINMLDRIDMEKLEDKINSRFVTDINIKHKAIDQWLNQFRSITTNKKFEVDVI
ncbi:capsular biosynthesis protein [Halobacillus halophilus]|uniref:Polysaccharide pyruvyl transferase domain-containing protein n=1 Tax=Halobacillus halophilus (strain ATCC 35676 / DSM 2266 / JCM 20832 / KCTC 3685 / LMG 17431 / NBRC 102448 / NCIMB 2269) TaxID=866895 RepID=I0JJL9_HALH3|nr:polysaccharide pyruvyl transferase family protein [Halobacillus halophilus]ASF38491.1 capsular biosynthesis protein [Halobacillus halophilus]CCG44337.1 hypothetical protein HBHAL_1976 [Halobacillus halophilus DSM 2266]